VSVGITVGSLAYAPFYLADVKGYFSAQNLQVDLVNFTAGNAMIPSLATNQLQAAGISPGPPFYNAIKSGIDFTIVGDTGSTPIGRSSQALVIRKALIDSGKFKSYADLKGLTVAVPTRYAANEWNLREALSRGGLGPNDVKIQVLSYPDMAVAFTTGKIDAAIDSEPYTAQGVAQGFFVRYAGGDELYPNHQIGALMFNNQFLKTDVAKRFYLAYIQGAREYNDAFFKDLHRAETTALLAKWTKVDASMFDSMHFQGIDPDGVVNIHSLQTDFEFLKSAGQVNVTVDWTKIHDPSFSSYAISKLGKYKQK
jgi:NitT/TauT family transport system substrate-binding protein